MLNKEVTTPKSSHVQYSKYPMYYNNIYSDQFGGVALQINRKENNGKFSVLHPSKARHVVMLLSSNFSMALFSKLILLNLP